MNWRLKLSNWLSDGALDKYRRQEEIAQAKLKQQEMTVDSLRAQVKQYETDIERYQAQLTMNEGFKIELGETEIKLKSATDKIVDYEAELKTLRQQLSVVTNKQSIVEEKLFNSQDWFKQVTQPVKIVEIKKLIPKQEFDTLWGFGVNSPKQDETLTGGSILIQGWVLGRQSSVSKVQITSQERIVLEAKTGLFRPAITQRYPDIPEAGKCGFECALATVAMPSQTELAVEILMQDERVIPLCAIVLQKQEE